MIGWFATEARAEPNLDGHYRIIGDPSTLAAQREGGIDNAIASLPWLLRGIARPFLESAVHDCFTVDLHLDNEAFSVNCNHDGALIRSRTIPLEVTGNDGRQYSIGLKVGPADVLVSWDGSQGGQRSWYKLLSNGTLQVRREIYSDKLPESITWVSTYEPIQGDPTP